MSNELISAFASQYQLEPAQMRQTLLRTVFPAGNASEEHLIMFIAVAKQYNLNPFTREIFAFPGKGGGIQPIVSIDGWLRMINRHPEMDGLETEDHIENGQLVSVTARIYIKNRAKPVVITEYMSECRRATDTWKQWPARMLRHKAVIQCARYAFSFSGIMDEDEYGRMVGKDCADVDAQVIEQVAVVGDTEVSQLRDLIAATNTSEQQFCSYFKVDCVESLPLSSFAKASGVLSAKLKKMQEAA